jgi:hypothetical protein
MVPASIDPFAPEFGFRGWKPEARREQVHAIRAGCAIPSDFSAGGQKLKAE